MIVQVNVVLKNVKKVKFTLRNLHCLHLEGSRLHWIAEHMFLIIYRIKSSNIVPPAEML